MKKKMRTLFLSTAILSGLLFLASCSKNDVTSTASQQATVSNSILKSGTNGIKSAIPAYYDDKLFKIIFVEFPPNAEATLIAHNPGINFIYQSDPGLPGGLPFISVIDAIPADGMNPVWQEVQIVFNPGFTPHQFTSDNAILAAAAGSNPEITLIKTTQVYRCPVIGKKP